jgi:hypothetical protein
MATPQESVPQATLADFIKDNSTLVTSFAAFVALTAFSSQLTADPEAQVSVSAFAMFAALIIGIELFYRIPFVPHHWRLGLFRYVLLGLLFAIGQYWFEHFKSVWVGTVLSFARVVVGLLILGLFAYLFGQGAKIFWAHILKREMSQELIQRISLIGLIASIVLMVSAWVWGLHRFGGRTYEVRTPAFIQNLMSDWDRIANKKL